MAMDSCDRYTHIEGQNGKEGERKSRVTGLNDASHPAFTLVFA